ncbi:hypothetical protein MPTK1_4g23740 [Marchantia polymorpha subsp. ruderalis]|uniref:Uncharacterized protein n=2 Tax=Marchantia polymorpha TaxID=3197 RepID=A0AAF6BD32_MARPO|nr:hypothetical protein MARPO_0020s0137 [Marchantia polymorpha]BBN09913.1 hypothetical protein Mp_4g23740 [Marchantia polymorpha subsp. ruderalis]PTQ44491.1 hypothetical protein MARPO_0020s0137 [Marchantia polymorpha]PTQ44492.1 hypothetical protein MARPO_0020s0137 [Marchantia polymorpha]PTQ44493.1 hypothetical protein MARPO_0020s0137 [Marchantia polymorpha]|eukprot:PTQ44490.1 hypothetical protein MARPO_0020s0137 [Marchantia polymorpha]
MTRASNRKALHTCYPDEIMQSPRDDGHVDNKVFWRRRRESEHLRSTTSPAREPNQLPTQTTAVSRSTRREALSSLPSLSLHNEQFRTCRA